MRLPLTRVFTDFHHSSLLRSLVLLFEERLHMRVYRPIGMQWYSEGYWGINDNNATARQFLHPDQAWKPEDGTPPLNKLTVERDQILGERREDGVYYVADPGRASAHTACTLEFFKTHRFDYVIASIPQHVPLFQELIRKYQPHAKLIVQVGNGWDLTQFSGLNVLASIRPSYSPTDVNLMVYHQEFDTDIFHPTENKPTKKIYSFINILQNMSLGWSDFQSLERMTRPHGIEWRSYGGQCRDGNVDGPIELAAKMREAMMIFHVKEGGDGFGHIIHNAYAVGRPVITRRRHYHGTLAERLLVPGTFIDLDGQSLPEAKNMITRLLYMPEELQRMGELAAKQFLQVVDYASEAREISKWLQNLR
jgi:hypothetical protein